MLLIKSLAVLRIIIFRSVTWGNTETFNRLIEIRLQCAVRWVSTFSSITRQYTINGCSLHDIAQTTPCSGSLLSGSRWNRAELKSKYHKEEWQENHNFYDFCCCFLHFALPSISGKIWRSIHVAKKKAFQVTWHNLHDVFA